MEALQPSPNGSDNAKSAVAASAVARWHNPASALTFADWDNAALGEPYPRMSPFRIMIMGLDCAGKTTLMYRLQTGGGVDTSMYLPMIGSFDGEMLRGAFQSQYVEVQALDVPDDNFRVTQLHAQLSSNRHVLVWVVDADSGAERIVTAARACHALLHSPVCRGRPFLLVCNKYDRPNAISSGTIARAFYLPGYTPLPDDSPLVTAIATELATAIPLPPLIRLIVSYCTFDSAFVRVIQTTLYAQPPAMPPGTTTAQAAAAAAAAAADTPPTSNLELIDALDWLMRAAYRRANQTHPSEQSFLRRTCALM